MSETLAYSFSANSNTRDGQADNPTTGNAVGDRDRFGFRSELLYVPSDDLSVRITADYDEFDEICCVVGSAAYGAANQVIALLGGKVIPNDPYTKKAFYDFDPTSKGENFGLSMHIEKNFSKTLPWKVLLLTEPLITMKFKMLILMQQTLLLQVQSQKNYLV